MENIREQLAENLDVAEWNWLIPHVKRDVVVLVSPDLDLLTVGEAIAGDDSSTVQHWLTQQLLAKPSSDQLSLWNSQPAKKFQSLIVSPYVLIQECPIS
jgi:hypothetical protein